MSSAMADFHPAFHKTGGHEGGYSNHPSDRGGETYRGISRRYWPGWEGWKIIDRQKQIPGFPGNLESLSGLSEMVAHFFKDNFWNELSLGKLNSQALAEELYDTAVNLSAGRAAIFFQKALNLTNRCGTDYPDLKEDGIIGPVTINTANRHKQIENVIKTVNILQGAHYIRQCELLPSQEEFFNGWLERVTL